MAKHLIGVYNLDTGQRWYFSAQTPLEAMNSLLYTLNLKHRDGKAKVRLAGGGRTLYVIHNGQTWSCDNRN